MSKRIADFFIGCSFWIIINAIITFAGALVLVVGLSMCPFRTTYFLTTISLLLLYNFFTVSLLAIKGYKTLMGNK